MKHTIPYEDSSVAVRTELPDSYGNITTAYLEVRDLDAANAYSEGDIESAVDGGGGAVTITSTAHGLSNGQYVHIWDTTSYNGVFAVSSVATDKFNITDTYVAAETSGSWGRVFSASPKNIGTLDSAATAGEATITLAATPTTAPTSGDLIRIQASAAGPAEDVRVAAYNSSTRVVTLEEYLEHDHTAAAVVYGRWLTVTMDFSSSTFAAADRFVFEWLGFDTDDIPFTEEAEVFRRKAAVGDLQGSFRAQYGGYYNRINPEYWNDYESGAWDELHQIFKLRGRDINTLVASHNIKPLWLAQIAYMIAFSGGDESEQERAAMTVRRNDLIDQYASSILWHDDDQDGAQEQDELSPAIRPWPRRNL